MCVLAIFDLSRFLSLSLFLSFITRILHSFCGVFSLLLIYYIYIHIVPDLVLCFSLSCEKRIVSLSRKRDAICYNAWSYVVSFFFYNKYRRLFFLTMYIDTVYYIYFSSIKIFFFLYKCEKKIAHAHANKFFSL